MSDPIQGGCLCGATRYSFGGGPKFAIQCYCRDCQHVSGGGHLHQFAVVRDRFETSGALKIHNRTSDSGNALEVAFCGECGSPIFKSTALAPDIVLVMAGSLDEPASFEPGKKVHEASRQPWDAG